jgi:hypothetical protein
MIKKDLIIAVLATFCLTATLFMIMPTRSQQPYDPWMDTNDDGIIDISEIYNAALAYGTLGDPTKNVTIAGVKSDILVLFSEVQFGPYETKSAEIAVGDYKTLHVWMWSEITGAYGSVTVRFQIVCPTPHGWASVYLPVDKFEFTPPALYAVKTYEVISPTLELTIDNDSPETFLVFACAYAKAL